MTLLGCYLARILAVAVGVDWTSIKKVGNSHEIALIYNGIEMHEMNSQLLQRSSESASEETLRSA